MSILPYSVREGLLGFRRAKFAVFTATSAMAVALVLIGLFGMLSYQAQLVTDWLRETVGELEIWLNEDVDAPMARALHDRASATLGVEDAVYVSPEEAIQIFQEEFGEGAEVFLEEMFLPASIRVRVQSRYANSDSMYALVDEFKSWNRVDDVEFNQPLLVRVQENLALINTTALSLGIIVILASIFLVANTIRLTIYARRLLIRTMKLVGATDPFIQRPFIVEGVLQGLLAGLIASGIVWGLFSMLSSFLPQIASSTFTMVILSVGITLAGGALGWIGSALAVRRFIRNVQLH